MPVTLAVSLCLYLLAALGAAVLASVVARRWRPAADIDVPGHGIAMAVLAGALWPVLALGALQLYSVAVLAKVAAL